MQTPEDGFVGGIDDSQPSRKARPAMLIANSIISILAHRFPWLRVNATADAALRSYLAGAVQGKNDSGLTVEAAMGAMLDALQTENAEIKRQFRTYVENHGLPKM